MHRRIFLFHNVKYLMRPDQFGRRIIITLNDVNNRYGCGEAFGTRRREWLRMPVGLAAGAFERLEHLAERGSLRPR